MKPWFQSKNGGCSPYGLISAQYGFILVFIAIVNACTGIYFQSADVRPPEPYPVRLSERGPIEYWTGIVFNGERIGFTHFKISQRYDNQSQYDINSEAYFHVRFLMYDKKINLVGYDMVAEDLTLIKFKYFFDLDGNHLTVQGRCEDDLLIMTTISKGQTQTESIPLQSPLFPTSAINLYPFLKGLEVGRQFEYLVFDGQTKTISPIEQKIIAYEESELFHGPAYRLKTRLHGHHVMTWLDQTGKPQLEMSLGGVIISALEDRIEAERYLTQAAINKHEPFLEYSLIKTGTVLSNPRRTHSLILTIGGNIGTFMPPSDTHQQCYRENNIIHCTVTTPSIESIRSLPEDRSQDISRFLKPSYAIPSMNPKIQSVASTITSSSDVEPVKIKKILAWMHAHIRKKPVDAFTALDVLETRQAECQGHAYLFAAFSRASGIPTRIANGIVYSKQHQGFLYHTWIECYLGDTWVAVDPIFEQFPADATHVKLIEGENISSLLPLIGIIGKLDVQIIRSE